MRVVFLSFEAALTIIWFWAAAWQFSLMNEAISDGGTLVGAFLFLAFGIGTLAMLLHEAALLVEQRFGLDLNPLHHIKLPFPTADNGDEDMVPEE